MKNNIFTFKNNMLLCWRLGPMNAQKQVHYSKDIETLAGKGTHKPPISRGFWAFPYPHYDFFFCHHQWEKHLPKIYQDDKSENGHDVEWWKEREKLLKQIRKKYKPSLFYTDKFYSHVFPNAQTDYDNWYYWDCVRDWANVAQKTLLHFEKYNDTIYKMKYSKDHLEIFVP